MSKTLKTNKQFEQEKSHGKVAYRKRIVEEQEATQEVEEFLEKFTTHNKEQDAD